MALADQLVQGLKCVCESALDTLPLLSRASAYAVVLRRLVWLKCWSVDQSSKKALVDLPFKGERLFGASLDDIIKDATGGKSTLLPQSGKGKEPRRRQGPSFLPPPNVFFIRPVRQVNVPRALRRPLKGRSAPGSTSPTSLRKNLLLH